MKKTLMFLAVTGLLFSCNNTEKHSPSTETTIVKEQEDTTASKKERQILIGELERLQKVFSSNDKEKIADIFQFPVSGKTVEIYTEDNTFNAQYEKNGNKLTRAMFIHFFPQISESLQIGELNQLFERINLNELLQSDMVKNEAVIKTEPCYNFYSVKVEKDLVTLTLGINSNRDYKSKSVTEGKMPENSSELCESVLWWVFQFDGKKLNFKNISGAG
ncbi:hypothetical protein [Flavobacterium microcysteis]